MNLSILKDFFHLHKNFLFFCIFCTSISLIFQYFSSCYILIKSEPYAFCRFVPVSGIKFFSKPLENCEKLLFRKNGNRSSARTVAIFFILYKHFLYINSFYSIRYPLTSSSCRICSRVSSESARTV